MRHCRTLLGLLVLIPVLSGSNVAAQSTIFNTPTTDTVAMGRGYVELDFLLQAPGQNDSRIYLYNPRLIIGAPGNLELGVNFPTYQTRALGFSSTSGYVQPNAKRRLYSNEKNGVALAIGGLWNIPLNNRNGQDSWGMLYGLASKKIRSLQYGPRFHAGAYGILSANQNPDKGPVSFTGPRAGAILGYEQPVRRSLSLVADWLSGKNGLGYFTPGISVALPKNGLLNAGYSIGNDSWTDKNAAGNRYFFLYYGLTF